MPEKGDYGAKYFVSFEHKPLIPRDHGDLLLLLLLASYRGKGSDSRGAFGEGYGDARGGSEEGGSPWGGKRGFLRGDERGGGNRHRHWRVVAR